MSIIYRCPTGPLINLGKGEDQINGCGSWNTVDTVEGTDDRRVLVVDCQDCGIWFEPSKEPNIETREGTHADISD